MAMNMSAILRIAAKVVGKEELDALQRGLLSTEKAANEAASAFKVVTKSSVWQAAAVAATGFTVALGLSTKAAIDFESSMADVRKVVDGLETPAAINEIKSEIIDLSRQMPIAATGFAEIYAAAGASGIAKDQLKDFAVTVAQVAVAFDMTAAEAGQSLAQLRVSLGLTTPQLGELADAMNYLDNNTGASARNLVEFMSRSGAVGKMAGLTGQQTAAFGAAMIQTGVQSEVAATSFNNMIKALSKGPSMTERQVSALQRMGYSMVNAAAEEQRLTRAISIESEKRIGVYREETDQLLREISRRYRNQQQRLQDNWDDEYRAFERTLQDRADAQVRAINQSDQLSEDEKDRSIRAIQAQLEAEMTARRRADRDRQQAIKDRLDDQQEQERKAAEVRFRAAESTEKRQAEVLKAAAKKTAEAMANQSAQSFADRLQRDGIGTLTEVLGKIAALPRSQQVSVLSDLFGDEARGLAPLLANLGELERILGLAGNKGRYTGSVLKEFQVRSATAANSLQLFQNNLQALQITIGDTVLPALVKLSQVFGPMIKSIADLAAANPVLTTVVVTIGSIASALVLLAPGILATVVLIGKIGSAFAALKLGATIGGWLPAIIAPFTSALAWIGSTFIPAILALFSGPAGWTVLAVAAVVAMVALFREPIGKFLLWMVEGISNAVSGLLRLINSILVQPLVNLWNTTLRLPVESYLSWMRGLFETYLTAIIAVSWQVFVQPFLNIWDVFKVAISAFWSWLTQAVQLAFKTLIQLAYIVYVKPWVDMWQNVLRKPVSAAWDWLQGLWGNVVKFFNEKVITPIRSLWFGLVDTIKNVMTTIAEFLPTLWQGIINTLKNIINNWLRGVFTSIQFVVNSINGLIQTFNQLPGPDITPLPPVAVPQLAAGAYLERPTLAIAGEAGPEYVIPAAKMPAAAAAFQAGARGPAVLAGAGGGRPTINITTGPVLQQSGQQWVTVDDLQAAVSSAVAQARGEARRMISQPSSRMAMGIG